MTTVTGMTTAPEPRLTTASRVGPLVAVLARRAFVPFGTAVLLVAAGLGVLYGIALLQDWQVASTPDVSSADGSVVWIGVEAEPGRITLRGLAWFVPFTAGWGAVAVVAGLPRFMLTLVGLGSTRRAVGIATLIVVAGLYLTVPALTAVGVVLDHPGRWADTFAEALPVLTWLLALLLLILDVGLLGLRRGASLAFALLCSGLVAVTTVALLNLPGIGGPWALLTVIAALTCGFAALMARLPVE